MEKLKDSFGLDMVSVRLVKEAPLYSNRKILSPKDAVMLLGKEVSEYDREVVCVINLTTKGMPINATIVSIGELDGSIAHPRELLKSTFLCNAKGIILLHNHPSGSLEPSRQDVMITDRLMQLCSLSGISLFDHVIVGTNMDEYFSFREKSILPESSVAYTKDYMDLNWKEVAMVSENTGRNPEEEAPDSVRSAISDSKQFTAEELLLLSEGMTSLIRDVEEAAKLLPETSAHDMLRDLSMRYRELKTKVRRIWSESV